MKNSTIIILSCIVIFIVVITLIALYLAGVFKVDDTSIVTNLTSSIGPNQRSTSTSYFNPVPVSTSSPTTISSPIPVSTSSPAVVPTTISSPAVVPTTTSTASVPMTCDLKNVTAKTDLKELVYYPYGHYRDANNTRALTKQYIKCDRKPINSFLLKTSYLYDPAVLAINSINYEYKCCNGGNYDQDFIHNETVVDTYGDGSIDYLNRHEVKCPSDSVISEFKLMNPTYNTINYSYECIKSKKPLTCRDVTTDLIDKYTNAEGVGNIINLEKFNIECNPDEAINSFKLITANNGNKVGYTYKCCK